MCSGGIHDSGNRPSCSSCRSQRASIRSVFARRLRPRNALVSTGSARCVTAPQRSSARATNSQPVHASTATCTTRPANRPTHCSTAAGVESIFPRNTSPVPVSTASKVICRRCTSNPTTIAPALTPTSNAVHRRNTASVQRDRCHTVTHGRYLLLRMTTARAGTIRARLQPGSVDTEGRPPAASPAAPLPVPAVHAILGTVPPVLDSQIRAPQKGGQANRHPRVFLLLGRCAPGAEVLPGRSLLRA